MNVDSRAAIRHAAASLFAQRNYGDTTIRDIAELAEVSPALVIKHFRSKGELYLEVGPNTERLADLELPRDVLGHAFVKQIFDRYDRGLTEPWIDNLVAIRQSPVPKMTRSAIRDRVVSRVAELIGDTTSDSIHAQAVAATVIGIAHAVRELGLFDKEESERARVVQYLSLLIQRSIDACQAPA
ncbi:MULTISPECIES: TetR/AcrR family transcriptional regulator [unclassified Microbacterium]|uniref:TetR/AcrR family transcriptional regulator n=1 Tax=unclassified Microbacterium TaxID=2609290 RepID=UPI003466CC66